MTNRRITKAMAADAAGAIAKAKYGQIILDMNEKLKDLTDSLLQKYIPQPVLSVVKEYERYFSVKQSIIIVYKYIDEQNYTKSSHQLGIPSHINVTSYGSYIEVSEDDYKEAKKLVERIRQICNVRDNTERELTDVIRSCNTEANLIKRYPDIHHYIEWPPVKALPANVTQDWVNNLMDDIKKSNL